MKFEFYGKVFDTMDKAESFRKQVANAYLESAKHLEDKNQNDSLLLLKAMDAVKKAKIKEVTEDDIDRNN